MGSASQVHAPFSDTWLASGVDAGCRCVLLYSYTIRHTVPDLELFTVAPGSTVPIYRQLIELVRRRVAAGQLKAGDELPSVRELAQVLAVNPMTVSKAYSLLEAEGLLERRRGLSMVVAEGHRGPQHSADRAELLRPTLERAAEEARQLQLTASQALSLFKTILHDTKDLKP